MVLLSKSTRCFEIFLDAEPQRGYTQLELNLCYEIGGMNWFHGEVNNRGYFVSVRMAYRDRDTHSFIVGDGLKYLIEPAKSFSAKKFDAMVESLDFLCHEKLIDIMSRYGVGSKYFIKKKGVVCESGKMKELLLSFPEEFYV